MPCVTASLAIAVIRLLHLRPRCDRQSSLHSHIPPARSTASSLRRCHAARVTQISLPSGKIRTPRTSLNRAGIRNRLSLNRRFHFALDRHAFFPCSVHSLNRHSPARAARRVVLLTDLREAEFKKRSANLLACHCSFIHAVHLSEFEILKVRSRLIARFSFRWRGFGFVLLSTQHLERVRAQFPFSALHALLVLPLARLHLTIEED